MPSSHLLVISDRAALAWVLGQERMAFPGGRRGLVSRLEEGDELLLYTTRGCWHNPGRDRGRVIGRARALGSVEQLRRPVEVAGRSFPLGLRLELVTLAPLGSGVELSPLVERLAVFPIKHAWSGVMRRPLVELPAADAALLERLLRPLARPPHEVLSEYLAAGQRAASR